MHTEQLKYTCSCVACQTKRRESVAMSRDSFLYVSQLAFDWGVGEESSLAIRQIWTQKQ